MKKKLFFILSLGCFILPLQKISSQDFILGINSSTKMVYTFNTTDGSLLSSAFIDLNSYNSSTPKSACQVGDSIWIASQSSDNILIFALDGTYGREISGNLDNIRGMNKVGSEIWVTNAGSNNGATSNTLVRYDTAGNYLGNYATIASPFDVIDDGNGTAYICSFSGDGIEKMDYSGSSLGVLPNSTSISFYEQINFSSTGSILAAVFITPNEGLNEISTTDGSILNFYGQVSDLRGVIELDNGQYLVCGSNGVQLFDPATLTASTITTGNFQYFTKITETMGVEDVQSANSLSKIFPNPVQNNLNIQSQKQPQSFEIYNANGSLVKKIKSQETENTIDVSNLSSGSYILKVQYQDQFENIKFIKK